MFHMLSQLHSYIPLHRLRYKRTMFRITFIRNMFGISDPRMCLLCNEGKTHFDLNVLNF